ncbi:MAG TPA: tyrosinase family protein [Candidatus Dormibacteraeota bacterium]|nr:tyrosinase family protein [Candidatus Dormibacteraeota bacterium]
MKFHRLMIRNFKWILMTVTPQKYFYVPWADFPNWLSEILDAMDPFYRQRLGCAIDEKVLNTTLDELGRLIEGRPDKATFPDVHSKVHLLVSIYEQNVFGPQPACDMSDPRVAAYNEHFWKFHGWIDEIYARWQTAHGEAVDQSPLKPMEPMEMCPECKHPFESVNPWLAQWQAYLRSRS